MLGAIAALGASYFGGGLGSLGTTLGSLAGDWLGGEQDADNAMDRQIQAQQFSAEQYAKRYQVTMKDMEAAGMNPMLAYQGVGGSFPTGSPASPGNNFSGMGSRAVQAAATSAQIENVRADTLNKTAQANLIDAQTSATLASADVSRSSLSQIDATVDKIRSEIDKIKGDTNFDTQQEILRMTAWQLQQAGVQAQEMGMTQGQQRVMIQSTIDKLISETRLNQLDLDAAAKMDNIGREAGQLRPMIEMILGALRSSRRD